MILSRVAVDHLERHSHDLKTAFIYSGQDDRRKSTREKVAVNDQSVLEGRFAVSRSRETQLRLARAR
jgi:hypothetical protein